jgi:hypothetical protein
MVLLVLIDVELLVVVVEVEAEPLVEPAVGAGLVTTILNV